MPRQVRYEGSQLDDVLERVRDDHGAAARIVSADLTRSRGVGGFFARETYQVVVELDAEGPAAIEPAPVAVPAAPVVAPAADPPPPTFASTPERGATPDFARVLTDLVADPPAEVMSALGEPQPTVATPAAPAPIPVMDDDDRPRHRADAERPIGPVGSEPLDVSPVALGDLVARLSTMVQPASPLPTSGIITVVGARADAVEAAVSVAQACGRVASEVMLAAPTDASVTPRTIGAVVTESVRRRHQRGDSGPVVVAVAVAPGVEGTRWATEVVTALDAVHVRVAAGAWRPIERTASLIERVRSVAPVAALDLIEIESAPAPERFLGLGVAIGTIDGLPSTAMSWAATLLDCGRAAAVVGDVVLAPATRPAVPEAVLDDRVVIAEPPIVPVDEPVVVADVAASREPVAAVFPTVQVPSSARR